MAVVACAATLDAVLASYVSGGFHSGTCKHNAIQSIQGGSRVLKGGVCAEVQPHHHM